MEQTLRGAKLRRFTRRSPHIGTPSPRISLLLIILVTFLTAVIVVNTLAKRLNEVRLPNPLASFSDLLPGQSLDVRTLEGKGFSCWLIPESSPADIVQRCSRYFQTGSVSQIDVTLWDGINWSLHISFIENAPTVGDLIMLWGKPQIRMVGDRLSVSWSDHYITGSGQSRSGLFSYFLPVSHLWLSRAISEPQSDVTLAS